MLIAIYTLLFISWFIAGIATIAKVVTENINKPDGPIIKKLDTLNNNISERVFIAILLGLATIAIFLWPLVIAYLFFTSTPTKKELSGSVQPRE